MLKIIFSSLLTLSLVIGLAQSTEFTAFADQSSLTWVGYGELGGFTQTGSIDIKSVSISTDGGYTGSIIVDMKSISHEDNALEKHLKAKDFFNVKKYPTSTFEIASVEDGMASGKLTINGITNPITFPITITAEEDSLNVSGKAVIDRTSFDIKYNSSSYFQDLGNYAIKNNFDLVFDVVLMK